MKNRIQSLQNSLFELNSPLAIHMIEDELQQSELKYQIFEWLFEKYKEITNEKNDKKEKVKRTPSPLVISLSSPEKKRRETLSPKNNNKKKVIVDKRISDLISDCSILGICNSKDSIYISEKGLNPHLLEIYERLIEMINIAMYFKEDLNNEETKIENPLKYQNIHVETLDQQVTKDLNLLHNMCKNKLNVLYKEKCGTILSKDLSALVNIEKNSSNHVIDVDQLAQEIESTKDEISKLHNEYEIIQSKCKYNENDDNTQVLHAIYTLSQHLSTFIESFSIRYPMEIEPWLESNTNQKPSKEMGDVISRLSTLLKSYQMMMSNIRNIKNTYEAILDKSQTKDANSSQGLNPYILKEGRNSERETNEGQKTEFQGSHSQENKHNISPLIPTTPTSTSTSTSTTSMSTLISRPNSKLTQLDKELKILQKNEMELQQSLSILNEACLRHNHERQANETLVIKKD